MSTKKFTRNKQEKIDLIYNVFFDLISKNGYHKTSTNHVAESAKISIGTIYKYFPKGKEDIIRKYFEESMKSFLDGADLIKITDENVREMLNYFILDLLENHKKNKGYNLAFRSAIQSDTELLETYEKRVYIIFIDLVKNLRTTNDNFKVIPEEKLIEVFLFTYNLVNAILYHHLSIMNLFKAEKELVDYLLNLVVFSMKYILRN